ncbi:MAG: serine/threonine-protein kinase [Actinomycetota bacterium]
MTDDGPEPEKPLTDQVRGSRYELIEVIGSGGMGTVWKARDRELGRFVALKAPHPVAADDPRHDRLAREAHLAAAVSHRNLVEVHDVGVDHDGPYLVMEFVDAPSLRDVGDALSPKEILTAAAEVAEALAAIHAAGIVHRDVKPRNVLLPVQGAKLVDFGLAKALDGIDGFDATAPGVAFGTITYAAPEVKKGKPATDKSDMYGFGVTFAALLIDSNDDDAGPAASADGSDPSAGTETSDRLDAVRRSGDMVTLLLAACQATDPDERPSARAVARVLAAEAETASTVVVAPVPASTAAAAMTAAAPSAGPSLDQPSVETEPLVDASSGSLGRSLPPWATRGEHLIGAGIAIAVVLLVVGALLLSGGGSDVESPGTGEEAQPTISAVADRSPSPSVEFDPGSPTTGSATVDPSSGSASAAPDGDEPEPGAGSSADVGSGDDAAGGADAGGEQAGPMAGDGEMASAPTTVAGAASKMAAPTTPRSTTNPPTSLLAMTPESTLAAPTTSVLATTLTAPTSTASSSTSSTVVSTTTSSTTTSSSTTSSAPAGPGPIPSIGGDPSATRAIVFAAVETIAGPGHTATAASIADHVADAHQALLDGDGSEAGKHMADARRAAHDGLYGRVRVDVIDAIEAWAGQLGVQIPQPGRGPGLGSGPGSDPGAKP